MIQTMFIGTTEILIIAGIILLLFGGAKIPELMRSMGRGYRSFKEGVNGTDEEPATNATPQKRERRHATAEEVETKEDTQA